MGSPENEEEREISASKNYFEEDIYVQKDIYLTEYEEEITYAESSATSSYSPTFLYEQISYYSKPVPSHYGKIILRILKEEVAQ